MKDRLWNSNSDVWNGLSELEYQIGFDRPIFVEPEKPKQPVPTKPIRRRRIPEVLKHHIKKTGK